MLRYSRLIHQVIDLVLIKPHPADILQRIVTTKVTARWFSTSIANLSIQTQIALPKMRLPPVLLFLAIYGQLHTFAQRGPHGGSEPHSIPKNAPEPESPVTDPHPPSDPGSGSDPLSQILDAPVQEEPVKVNDPKADIGDAIQSLLDAIMSIVEVQGGSTITSAAPLPTAAYPCLHAEKAYNHCSSHFTAFVSAPMSAQASCLCYNNASKWSPDRLEGYISGCNDFVQAHTTFSAGNISSGLGLCTSAGDVRASASVSSASKASASDLTSSTSVPTQAPATGIASGRVMSRSLLPVLGCILLCSAVS